MSDDGGWDIVTAVIVPLAERLEAASKAAYPAGSVHSVTLDRVLISTQFETGRRFLEFFISPPYGRVFQRTIEGPIIRFRRLEIKVRFKGPDTWGQEDIDEYNVIWEARDSAADYLRQLAWMIKGKREQRKQELEGKGKVRATYADEMTALDQLPVMRRKKMGEKTLAIIGDCIKRGKTPMQCLMRELKNVARDRWLDDLRVTFPEIRNHGDFADRENSAHMDAFDRFKKVGNPSEPGNCRCGTAAG